MSDTYYFESVVWAYPGEVAWHFESLPKDLSSEIKAVFGSSSRGWGSLPVEVTLGQSTWDTSIFWDSKSNTYLLPLKAAVRKRESIQLDKEYRIKSR